MENLLFLFLMYNHSVEFSILTKEIDVKKLCMAAIMAVLMFWGSVAQATPITISNWQFTWGNNQYEDGIGWIWDMDSVLEPFQVRFNKTSLIDPLGPIDNWITPLSYAEGSYVFEPIHLGYVLGDVYKTSVGNGEWFSGGDNPFNDGVTFLEAYVEITQVSSAVPEPSPFTLLAAGLVAIGLTGKRRKMSRQY